MFEGDALSSTTFDVQLQYTYMQTESLKKMWTIERIRLQGLKIIWVSLIRYDGQVVKTLASQGYEMYCS